jgi:hypothetical protein
MKQPWTQNQTWQPDHAVRAAASSVLTSSRSADSLAPPQQNYCNRCRDNEDSMIKFGKFLCSELLSVGDRDSVL